MSAPVCAVPVSEAPKRASAARVRRVSAISEVGALTHCRILLLEDNPGDADLVMEYLDASERADVVHKSRLDDALDAVHNDGYDIIVVDLTLPDAVGLDAVRRLGVAAPAAALVVLSGIESEAMAVEAVRCGAQDYLVKGEVTHETLKRALRYARERKSIERRLAHMAHHDPLTGVGNRRAMLDHIGQCVARARRHGSRLALMFIDLDQFKPINDTHGHGVGDKVLKLVAERLCEAVREYDTVARLGGDEFAVLVDSFAEREVPLNVAQRVAESLARPMTIGDLTLSVTASIGVASFPSAARTSDDLLRLADTAMYEAKARGLGVVDASAGPSPIAQPATVLWRSCRPNAPHACRMTAAPASAAIIQSSRV